MAKAKSKRRQTVRARKSRKQRRRTRIVTRQGTVDIEHGLGRMASAQSIARSIKRAADAGSKVKDRSFHAAMAAMTYLIHHLEEQLARLRAAQDELQRLYAPEKEPARRLRVISRESAPKRARTRTKRPPKTHPSFESGRGLVTGPRRRFGPRAYDIYLIMRGRPPRRATPAVRAV